MSEQLAFLIAVIIHGCIFLILFLVWFFTLRRSSAGTWSPLVRSKILLEQKLVLEAISAANAEKNLHSLLVSIGKHAAEITGFEEWVLWLREEGTRFGIVAVDLEINPEAQQALSRSSDPELFSWVIQNAAPARMGGFANKLASTGKMGQTLMRLSNGLMIPFTDGARVIGFAIVGGRRQSREKRSNQCLSLFGASAAILIKNRRLHEQEKLLRERQERAEKLASLGKVAAGLAHEIRNPLGFIKVSVQHLQSKYEFADEDRETTDDVVDEIDQVSSRIEELLVLGRIDPQSFSAVELGGVIRRAVRLAESKAKAGGVEIDLSLESEAVLIHGSEDLLRQLFLNLILNGLEAMPSGGILTVKNVVADGKAEIEVRDSGSGIPEEIAGRIFDPFFTTKETGTGLGLSLAFNVAQAHEGTLELKETGRDGTSFVISLPLADTSVAG